MSLTKRTTNITPPVAPSSRDAIESWLDVLTAMLSLPPGQKAMVRDELEDHLRSRVDDLLITGTPEPEAIRTAVAELGETAQLAKLIASAHTYSSPRRTIMNTALISVAAAGIALRSFTLFNASSSLTALPIEVAASQGETVNQNAQQPTRDIDILHEPLLVAFQQLAMEFDLSIDIHSLDQVQVHQLQGREVSIAGTFSLRSAMQALLVQSLTHAADLTYEIEDDTIELLTHDEQARRTVKTQVLTLDDANAVQYINAAESFEHLLQAHSTSPWLSIEPLANGIAVAAPAAMNDFIDQTWSLIQRQHADAIRSQEKLAAEREAQRRQGIDRIKAEYESIRQRYVAKGLERGLADQRLSSLEGEIFTKEMTPERREELKAQRVELEMVIQELMLDLTDLEARHSRLQSLLIDTEYEGLLRTLH